MAVANLGRVSFVLRGDYSASQAYTRLDVVNLNGYAYAAISDVPAGNPPPDTTYWQQMSVQGPPGAPGSGATQAQVEQAVETYFENNPSAGLSQESSQLLITILQNALYNSDQSQNISDLATLLGIGGDTPTVNYTVTLELINATSSNGATSVTENTSYTTTLSANEGYTMTSATVTVLMGGVDITATAYSDGVITIAAVTGNVEIIASAVAEQGASGELNTNGLVFDFDFRNVTMEAYNLSGWGNVYRTVDKTNTALLFGTAGATGTDMGLNNYSFRENRLVASETEKVRLGTAYTVQALYSDIDGDSARMQPNLFNWMPSGTNMDDRYNVAAKYLAGTAEKATGNTLTTYPDGKYMVVTYVVNGNNLDIYFDSTKVGTYNGADYEGFTQWMDYGVPKVTWSGGTVAFVGYNRALTEAEIIDNLAFFQTLEVSA